MIAGLVGVISVIISVINFFNLDASDNLSFNAARLLATVAGIALAVILGAYVLVTFSTLFVLGFIALTLGVVALFFKEVLLALVKNERHQPFVTRYA